MSKHDIRLRRQKFTARGTDRYRNYGAVLERHEKEKRLRKVVRVFSMLFIILIIIVMIVIVVRVEKRTVKKATIRERAQYVPKITR
jgi:hypothetical protein